MLEIIIYTSRQTDLADQKLAAGYNQNTNERPETKVNMDKATNWLNKFAFEYKIWKKTNLKIFGFARQTFLRGSKENLKCKPETDRYKVKVWAFKKNW